MINIEFYTLSKKQNSTKQPSRSDATVMACTVKDQCGLTHPVIVVDTVNVRPTFNYIYIPDFGRYYFIQEWSYNNGLWECSAAVDVLATYKQQIALSTQYVLRCADEDFYNINLTDNYYPITGFVTTRQQSLANPWDASGCYILGIIGNGNARNSEGALVHTATLGSVQYFVFTASQITALTNYLFGTGYMAQLTGDQITEDYVKTNHNPFQYIASVQWFPVSVSEIQKQSVAQLSFGWLDVTCSCYSLGGPFVKITDGSITTPKNPQASTRGNFLNIEPFSRYTLFYPPFGSFPLDSLVVGNDTSVKVIVDVDFLTGNAILRVRTSDNKYILNAEAVVGVPIQLSQISRNVFPTISSVIGNVARFAGSIISGTPSGLSLGNNAEAIFPQLQTTGSNGSRAFYNANFVPTLVNKTVSIADENLDHAGRPCCKELVLNNLTGYVLCADGEISIAATEPELDSIRSYLTSGFFME